MLIGGQNLTAPHAFTDFFYSILMAFVKFLTVLA